jgi:DNA-binding response OmpR family regulator
VPGAAVPVRAETPAAPRRVLIVERDADFRRLLEAEFQEVGEGLESVARGVDGLETADRLRPDLIVVGQELEDMHGLEFVRRLHRSPVTADLPTLLVGGASPPTEAVAYGADGWVPADGEAVVREARRVAALPRRRRILYVEDDPTVRDTLARLLRKAGYACLEAPDGEVGLAFARSRPPDVALLDRRMPGLDGLAMLRVMRADPELASVPVLILTGHVDPATHAVATEAGVEVMTKPVDGTALLRTLERLLEASHGGAPASAPSPA